MTGHISDIISLAGVDMTFKPNKDSEPLSEASPGPHDLALAKALEHELRAAGAFEGESEDAMRAKALSEVGKIVTDWAAGFYERMGIPVPGDSKKMAMILPFGSYALGVHSTDSDIDVLAVMPNHVSRHDFLAELEPIFKQHPSVEKLSVVPEAFVPVIKFHWEGVDIDLSFAQLPVKELPIPLDITDSELLRDQKDPKDVTCLNGPRVTYEILRRVRNAEHFRTFLRSIKLWARRKGIYSNIVGFPGGVAWAIMCANVCQLYPNLNPPMLLEKFFFLYLNWNFDNAIKIASVDECRAPAGAMYMPQWSPSAIYRPLQIITPTYPVANATFNACHSTVAIMHSEIALGHNVVQGVASAKHDFSVLFTPSDFFAKYSNYVCVDCSSDAMDDLKPFYGYLSSQVRKLVEKLESDEEAGLELAHPCTTHFGPRPSGNPAPGSESNHPIHHVHFYIGLKFDGALVKRLREAGQSVNLTAPVEDFKRFLAMHENTKIDINVVKKKMIPEWVKSAYKSQWGGPTAAAAPQHNGAGPTPDAKRKREEGGAAGGDRPSSGAAAAAEKDVGGGGVDGGEGGAGGCVGGAATPAYDQDRKRVCVQEATASIEQRQAESR